MTIPSTLFVGLLVFFCTSVPLDALTHALSIIAAALLAGGAIGFIRGLHGPRWPIYAMMLTGLALFLLFYHPWQGLTLVPIPVSAIGYAMGKEVAFFRLNLRQPFSPVTN